MSYQLSLLVRCNAFHRFSELLILSPNNKHWTYKFLPDARNTLWWCWYCNVFYFKTPDILKKSAVDGSHLAWRVEKQARHFQNGRHTTWIVNTIKFRRGAVSLSLSFIILSLSIFLALFIFYSLCIFLSLYLPLYLSICIFLFFFPRDVHNYTLAPTYII